MKERPILFSGQMVRAILGGRKTQTRRVVKTRRNTVIQEQADGTLWPYYEDEYGEWNRCVCPYGEIGDRLWVRETFSNVTECTHYNHLHDKRQWLYKATDETCFPKWKPSIHMPRKASRITLEIISVRVERLQDISKSDARREGIPSLVDPLFSVDGFQRLWESINGHESWDANPWVWVIEFKRVKP